MQIGKITQVMGPVVDVHFDETPLPYIQTALQVDNHGKKVVMEVMQHIGTDTVRCIMLSPSEGLQKDMPVLSTGMGIEIPVGTQNLGRLFNVLGDTIDGKEAIDTDTYWPIHRKPPKFEDQSPVTEVLETGIKVIDLIDMSKSLGYNPFHYIQSDKDVLKLITNLIRNTTPKGSSTNDPFWEKSETALLEALMLYLYHYAPEDEQNFTMVMEMLNYAEVKEDEDDYESPLDELFKRLETIDSNSLALKQYKIYKQAAGDICSK